MKHIVGHTSNNIPVFVDLIHSGAAKHIAQQPFLLTLAAEALQLSTLDGHSTNHVQDMGRVIGYDLVVETSADDSIFYAQLLRDSTYIRFVKNAKPFASRHLTMILGESQDNTCYELAGIWIGRPRPPWPGSAKETGKGNAFWKKHAFIFENQPVQSSTLTKICPY